jgi:hypothetical protein
VSCPVCANADCGIHNHDRLGNDAQALSLARKVLGSLGFNDRRDANQAIILLASWVVCTLAARKHGGR